jgi:hypothetical protein
MGNSSGTPSDLQVQPQLSDGTSKPRGKMILHCNLARARIGLMARTGCAGFAPHRLEPKPAARRN